MENERNRLVDTLPGLIWTALPDGRADFVNRRWCEYTGIVADEALGAGWTRAIHADDRPALRTFWDALVTSGKAGEVEVRMRRLDGEYRWFSIGAAPLTDADGKVLKWCGVNTDIEDRKRAETALLRQITHSASIAIEHGASTTSLTQALDELKRAEVGLSNIIDNIPAIAWYSHADGSSQFWNQRWHDYTGLSREANPTEGWLAAVHPDDRERLMLVRRTQMAAGRAGEVEARIRRFDGAYRWFLTRFVPSRDGTGAIVCWYGVSTDVDQQKIAEALLAGEKALFEMIAAGRPLLEVLTALCTLLDVSAARCFSSVLLLDREHMRVMHAVAPGLPPSYNQALQGATVSCEAGPCGMAMITNSRVIVTDAATDARWDLDGWPRLALAHGLKSCWSMPIVSSNGEVLGSFGVYRHDGGSPSVFHQELLEKFAHIASIAAERARAEDDLRRNEAFLVQAQRLTQTGSLWWKTSTGKITWSAQSYRLMDYPASVTPSVELTLRRCHPEDLPIVQQAVERSMQQGANMDFEHRLLMPDGSVKHVHVVLQNVSAAADKPEFVGAITDITDRKRAEDILRRNEAYLAQAQRLSLTGSFGWDLTADEQYWSAETFRILEYGASTKPTLALIEQRVHPEDIAIFHRFIALAVQGQSFDEECRLSLPSGAVKHVHFVAQANRRQDNHLELIGAIQDVTERRDTESVLDKTRSDLAHVTRFMSLGTLTASIAHEVNQPLAGIVTNASTCLRMLGASPPNVEGARETARRTIRDSTRASDVITRLRALFGKTGVSIERVNLSEAAHEVLALTWSDLQRRRVVVRTELADALPLVAGDRIQMQQVILNLLQNAADAMRDVHTYARELVIRTQDEGGWVRLDVQDAGVGFEPRDQARLFQPFYTTKSDGMGIGLSVSRTIVESHRGRLWATANQGPGATFSFSIPHYSEAAAQEIAAFT